MRTKPSSQDLRRILRLAAPPILALAVLAPVPSLLGSTLSSLEGVLLPAWRVAIVASVLWLAATTCWAMTRPGRDRRAYERLQQLRGLADESYRALVQIQTTVWTAAAGQHAVVMNVETGTLHRVWLPETAAPIREFVVLEHTDHGVRVIGSLSAPSVEAAHRHERRTCAIRVPDRAVSPGRCTAVEIDAAVTLIDEVEAYLRTESP